MTASVIDDTIMAMAWLLGVLALGAGVWIWRKGMKPAANDLTDRGSLARMLQLLLSRGVHKGGVQGTLTIQLRTAVYPQLVFRKHVDGSGRFGIRATFPRIEWSAPYYDRFLSELRRRGISHLESPELGVSLDIGRDFGLALMATQVLFQDVGGASVARDCVAYFHDVVLNNNPALTGVDSPDDGWG